MFVDAVAVEGFMVEAESAADALPSKNSRLVGVYTFLLLLKFNLSQNSTIGHRE